MTPTAPPARGADMERTHSKWLNGQRTIATAHDCKGKWGLDGQGFRCGLCGHHFNEGDGWRWIWMTGQSWTGSDGKTRGICNFKTCDACDGPDVRERYVERVVEFFSDKFWSLR